MYGLSERQCNSLSYYMQKWYPSSYVKEVIFQDTCYCMSEVTYDPCFLRVELYASRTNFYPQAERGMRKWARANLKWKGCSWCGIHRLDVDLRVFNEVLGRPKNWRPTPLKRYFKRSLLLRGQDAISFFRERLEKLARVTVVLHFIEWRGWKRHCEEVEVWRYDAHADGSISIYTDLGVIKLTSSKKLPPVFETLVEAIEVLEDSRIELVKS